MLQDLHVQAARQGAGSRRRLRLHGGAAGAPRPARAHAWRSIPNWRRWPAPTCSAPASTTSKCARPTAPRACRPKRPFDVIVLSGSVAEVPHGAAGAAQDRRPPGCHRRLRADDARHFHHAHRRSHLHHGPALGHGGAAAGPFPRAVALPLLDSAADDRPSSPGRPRRLVPVATGGGAGAVVLDVREPWELQTASVQAARVSSCVAIPMNEIPAAAGRTRPRRGPSPACAITARAASVVAMFLASNGFDRVANIAGRHRRLVAAKSTRRAALLNSPT